VVPDSPADLAGLQGGNESVTIDGQEILVGGDVIVGIDDQPVRKLSDLAVYMERNKRPGDWISLTFIRNGNQTSIPIELGERPLLIQ